ncbi:Transcription factor TGA7 [Bienertia sinuspersici]
MPSGSVTRNNSSCYSFEEFMQGWCHRLELLSGEITAAVQGKNSEVREIEARQLIARALGHFEEYFEHKSRAANLNVFALFSPTWCTSFECAFLWVSGFRPRVLLQLVSDSIFDLTPDQSCALDWLKRETKMNEKLVSDELARIQETAAAPPLMDAIREAAYPAEGHTFDMSREPIEQLRASLEAVVANADSLRVTTGAKVAEILTPPQCLRFLVAAIRLLQEMRSKGMQIENLNGWDGLKTFMN